MIFGLILGEAMGDLLKSSISHVKSETAYQRKKRRLAEEVAHMLAEEQFEDDLLEMERIEIAMRKKRK